MGHFRFFKSGFFKFGVFKSGIFRSESGQAIAAGLIVMLGMVGMIGLSIDAGSAYYNQRKLQVAADTVALAAAQQLLNQQQSLLCTVSSLSCPVGTAVKGILKETGLSAATLLFNCASATSTSLTIVVNNPPCSRGAADPNHGKAGYVEAVAMKSVPTTFIKILGVNTIALSARAEAGRLGGGNCIYALDPTGINAIAVAVGSSLSATCGVVDESNSWAAMNCFLGSTVNVTHFNVTGGVLSVLCNINPAINTSVPVPTPADPLAYLPAPTMPACGSSTASPFHGSSNLVIANGTVNTRAIFYPLGSYCGGIQIQPGANVTFEPGTYSLQPWLNQYGVGGLQIDLGATVTGNGVTFYNSGTTFAAPVTFFMNAINNNGNVTLTAPTSGTYSGILFFQPYSNQSPAIILGASSLNSTIEGAYYFPNALVNISLSGSAKYNILVAKDIQFENFSFATFSNSVTSFANNTTGLALGTPLNNGSATLVQ